MEFDAVVVGSGIAGCVTAFYLAKSGIQVAILNKDIDPEESNTFYAQGGVVYQGERDSPELRFQDIMSAGAGICNPDAVDIVVREGPEVVEQVLIEDFQVDFSRDEQGLLDITDEGAHSVKRILHSYDTTGKSIEEAAIRSLKTLKNVTFLNGLTAVDIISWEHHSTDKLRKYRPPTALGIYALNGKGKVEKIFGKTVILATGGMGRIYLHTTNPDVATGDGYAMAYRAGARLINMEYTQFHPTTLYHRKARNFLISEAVRGEGAVLRDRNGRAFMSDYHELKDLAPRDIVTRAMLSVMLESGEKYLHLDLSPIGKEKIKERFPYIYKTCLELGVDITQEYVPVVPAFHFSCGGVMTDMDGRTNVQRLFAVGEVACTGLHGANRLASTSLLEGAVFGRRVARHIIENKGEYLNFSFPEVPEWIDTGFIDTVDPALINQDWASLQNIMWNYVGALRSKRRLSRAITDLKHLRDEIEDFYRDTKVDERIVELRNAVQAGLVVALHAWANRSSIGGHYRTD